MKRFVDITKIRPDRIRIIPEPTCKAETLVRFDETDKGTDITVTTDREELSYVFLRWNINMGEPVRILGDDWERGYGTLEWRGIVKQRVMPWYCIVSYGDEVCCYGVRVRPRAMCSFTVDNGGITLCLDLRCGTKGVKTEGRQINAATIVAGDFETDEFDAACRFCRMMCDDPILPDKPVYGGNNWYYAYGVSSRGEILEDCEYIASLCKGNENRPHMIIDDGWQKNICSGPWDDGNASFGDMGTLAEEMKKRGVIPGIWIRLLHDSSGSLPARICHRGNERLLDPSHPEAAAHIAEDVSRVRNWGYRLLKHDYSTFDIFGRYGIHMTDGITEGDWTFYDRTKTSAEIVTDFYRLILENAGDMLIMGCNTMSHLCAGLVHINRTGDDTSGKEWERTRRLGVNTMAFRLCQNKAFYVTDADCAGITELVPWYYNKQWVKLLGVSGTPLFVSSKKGVMDEEQKEFVSRMFAVNSVQNDIIRPVDWTANTCPERWIINGKEESFDWFDSEISI